MHIQELIDEIEFQNHEVSSLLKEKKNLKIKILNLSNDLNIYKIMVLTLTKKNDEYQKKLKSIKKLKNDKFFQNFNSQKIISVTENNKNIKNIKNDFLDKRFKLYSSLQRKSNNIFNFDLNINNSKKKDFIKKNNYTIDNTISPMKLKFQNERKSYTTKKMKPNEANYSVKKEIEKYKDLYDFYKNKYEYIIKKYNNIFNMYNDALEKIYNEEINNKNNNDINININDFKDFKFEQMNPEQKYSILIQLINNIAPLICKKEFEDNSFIDKVFKVKQKYNIHHIDNKSFFSQTQNSFEISDKLKSKEKSLLKSPGGCTISTYLSPDSKKNKEKKNNFNRHYSNMLIFSKKKEKFNILHNLKIPQFINSKINNLHDSPFTYY